MFSCLIPEDSLILSTDNESSIRDGCKLLGLPPSPADRPVVVKRALCLVAFATRGSDSRVKSSSPDPRKGLQGFERLEERDTFSSWCLCIKIQE